jgi:BlaI family penicillinase repressor
MSEYEKISDNEWVVMEILWRDGEAKSSAISKELEETKGWAAPTVRTFLKRLISKKVADARPDEHDKRIFWYYPKVSRQDYLAYQTQGHLKRYYSGDLPQLMVGLLKNEYISGEELHEIENLIKSHMDKNGDEK